MNVKVYAILVRDVASYEEGRLTKNRTYPVLKIIENYGCREILIIDDTKKLLSISEKGLEFEVK